LKLEALPKTTTVMTGGYSIDKGSQQGIPNKKIALRMLKEHYPINSSKSYYCTLMEMRVFIF
jgi:hypothetical protein